MKKCFLCVLLLTGCASGPTDFCTEYREALAGRQGVVIAGRADGERLTAGFAALYGDLSPDNVESRVREVYAPEAWFNDTLATESGIEAIEKYLLKTAQGAQLVRAKINDVAVSGNDCYVRWTMEVRTKNLAGGRPVITEGMSQLRFDDEGRIVFHQDFWNPSNGIYQHLPLLGPAIRFVNGLIAK
ncbi:MAG: nuclear transport factor 2 family protein [Chthoniobacterales bacterium]|nr:nuclear transport factor 2 family protein [Chthoniobacterales bacterium]